MDIVGNKEPFFIDKTIQSQYSASPNIKNVIKAFHNLIKIENDVNTLFKNMIDIDTAKGYGLDVWGRILALPRGYADVSDNQPYLGFKMLNDATDPRLDTFTNAPFYNQMATSNVLLSDDVYYTYLMLKALINISNGSLGSLNYMLKFLFKDRDISIIHVDNMVLRLVMFDKLSIAEKQALYNMDWLPVGVELEIYQVDTDTFGFDGQELQTFDNGNFAN